MKYTHTLLHDFLSCQELQNGRFDILWGCDEMLLGAVATGANGAVGSTYNIAAPLYQRIIEAVNGGDLTTARELQHYSAAMVRVMNRFPFHGALKAMMEMIGIAVGRGCRMPLRGLSGDETTALKQQLEEIGYFEWSQGNVCGVRS
jgi:N-acetylneuraminate lyase